MDRNGTCWPFQYNYPSKLNVIYCNESDKAIKDWRRSSLPTDSQPKNLKKHF